MMLCDIGSITGSCLHCTLQSSMTLLSAANSRLLSVGSSQLMVASCSWW
jgi:hypothetical protein